MFWIKWTYLMVKTTMKLFEKNKDLFLAWVLTCNMNNTRQLVYVFIPIFKSRHFNCIKWFYALLLIIHSSDKWKDYFRITSSNKKIKLKSDEIFFPEFYLMSSQVKVVSLVANKQTLILFMMRQSFIQVIYDEVIVLVL